MRQEIVDVLGEVEGEIMRDSGALESVKCFMKANKLKRVEEELIRLEEWVSEAIQSKLIAQNSKELKNVKKDVEELKQNKQPHPHQFEQYFDSPSLPPNLVFDFDSFDNEGAQNTREGILLVLRKHYNAC